MDDITIQLVLFFLMFPCLWGVFYQINNNENLIEIIILFLVGSFVMRGAGCCINDFFDKDLDKKVTYKEKTAC